jgi:hypothetical protein
MGLIDRSLFHSFEKRGKREAIGNDKITNKKINFNKKPKHLALIID